MTTLSIVNPTYMNSVRAEEEAITKADPVTEPSSKEAEAAHADEQKIGGFMLSPAEMEAIGVTSRRKRLTHDEWRLDGVIYNTDEDWTVWLNTDMYSPERQPEGIVIVCVKPGQVQIQKVNQADAKPITLCLNQCVKL